MIIGNPVVFINNQKLKSSVKSLNNETIKLNEVIPFKWDVVYTFEPYSSKESIEEIIGFKSRDIKENNVNEGMVQLLFVKDKKVVASILGYSENLGYSIDFASKVTFEENAQFNVTKADGVTTLTYIKVVKAPSKTASSLCGRCEQNLGLAAATKFFPQGERKIAKKKIPLEEQILAVDREMEQTRERLSRTNP